MNEIQPNGSISLSKGIKVAHLALKHRVGVNHRMRIVLFIGSPAVESEDSLVVLGKKLKKEKVYVDIINFGEVSNNQDKLIKLLSTINGKDGQDSRYIGVEGPELSDALMASSWFQVPGTATDYNDELGIETESNNSCNDKNYLEEDLRHSRLF